MICHSDSATKVAENELKDLKKLAKSESLKCLSSTCLAKKMTMKTKRRTSNLSVLLLIQEMNEAALND